MEFLVGWADEHGKLPSQVLRLYKRNPRDFQLLYAHRVYRATREHEQLEREKKKTAGEKK